MDNLEAELERLLSETVSNAMEREIDEFNRLVAPYGKSLVLVGAGTLGRQVLQQLRLEGIEPLAFADNNPTLQGKFIDGVQVLSRQQAAERYGTSAAFVVTIWNSDHQFVQTQKELYELNCNKVVSAISFRWKHPGNLLPFFWLDLPSKSVQDAAMIKSAYSLWSDHYSKQEYLGQVKLRILGDFHSLSSPVSHQQYFPDDIFTLLSDEKFVDCGAFDGITIKHFLERRNTFNGMIMAFEPDPMNFKLLKDYVNLLDNQTRTKITVSPNAVGEKREKVFFNAIGTTSSSITNNGGQAVQCVPLDETLYLHRFDPTFIKMDIEGSELSALAGASDIIRRKKPVLAICVYHHNFDLWRIPLYIRSLVSDYHFFLRPYKVESWELVCYAVPSHRIK